LHIQRDQSSQKDNVVDLNQEQITFDKFWSVWQAERRPDKLVTMQKWDAITSEVGYHTQIRDQATGGLMQVHLKASPEAIYEGARRYIRRQPTNSDYSFKEPQYICTPAVWLNRGRWLDD